MSQQGLQEIEELTRLTKGGHDGGLYRVRKRSAAKIGDVWLQRKGGNDASRGFKKAILRESPGELE